MSDEHKRQAEYHARAAERAGHSADLEVRTTRGTRVDVVIDERIGFEVQRSQLTKAAAVDRTARSVSAGLNSVAWFTDRTGKPQWWGHVPGYRPQARGVDWRFTPLPGTVMAVGLEVVSAVRCGTREPCFHRRPCHRVVPSLEPWGGVYVDDVVRGLAEGTILPVRIGKYVRLVSPDSAALWEELTGSPLERYDAGQPKARPLAPAAEERCVRPPSMPTALPPIPAPVIPAVKRGACTVPECGQPASLYPCGWRCGEHAPGAPVGRHLQVSGPEKATERKSA